MKNSILYLFIFSIAANTPSLASPTGIEAPSSATIAVPLQSPQSSNLSNSNTAAPTTPGSTSGKCANFVKPFQIDLFQFLCLFSVPSPSPNIANNDINEERTTPPAENETSEKVPSGSGENVVILD